MRLQKDLREFIALLISHGVEFVVVGGYAVSFHGYPRYTGDIDLFVRASAANAARVMTVLTAFGFGAVGLSASDFVAPDKIVQLGLPPDRIDILTSISGVEFDQAWSSRVDATVDGLAVPFIGRAALIANKRASGRAKDLADADELARR